MAPLSKLSRPQRAKLWQLQKEEQAIIKQMLELEGKRKALAENIVREALDGVAKDRLAPAPDSSVPT